MPKIIGSRKTPRFRRRPSFAPVPGRALLSALSTAQIFASSSSPSGKATVTGLLAASSRSTATPSGKAVVVGRAAISSATKLGVIVVNCAMAGSSAIAAAGAGFAAGVASISGRAFSAAKSSGLFARISVLSGTVSLRVKSVAAATGKLPLAAKSTAVKVFGNVSPGFFVALGLDGVSTGSSSGNAVVSSTPLTTVFANDVIVALVGTLGVDSFPRVNTVFGGGLSWQKRVSQIAQDSNNGVTSTLDEWFAISSSPLNSVTVSATLFSTTNSTEANIVAFGICGANTVSPFDPNSSIPAFAANGVVAPSVAGISTTNAKNFIIGSVQGYQLSTGSPGSGFTRIGSAQVAGGAFGSFSALDSEYQIVSTQQSNATVSFGDSSESYIMIVDAVRAFSILQSLFALASITARVIGNQATNAIMIAKTAVRANAAGATSGETGMIGSVFSAVKSVTSLRGVTPIAANLTSMVKVIPAHKLISFMSSKAAVSSALLSSQPNGQLVMSGAAKFAGVSKAKLSGIAAVIGKGTSRLFNLGRIIGIVPISGKAELQAKAIDTSVAGVTISAMASLSGLAVKARGALLGVLPISGSGKAQGKAGSSPVGYGKLLAAVLSMAMGKSSPQGSVPLAGKGALTLTSAVKMSPVASLLATAKAAIKSVGGASPSMALFGRSSASVRSKSMAAVGASLTGLGRALSNAKVMPSGKVGLLGATSARVRSQPGLSGSIAFVGRSFVSGKGKATAIYTSVLTSVANATARAKASPVGRLTLSGSTKLATAGRLAGASITTNFLSIAGSSISAVKAFGSITLTFLPVPERTLAVTRTRVIAVANRVRTLMAKW